MGELDEIVKEFLVESQEAMDQVDRDLVELEKEPKSRPTWDRILRAVHSLKGTCGFLGLSKLEGITHTGESLLTKLRDGEMALDSAMTSVLLALVDAIRQILAAVKASGAEGEQDYSGLVETMTALKDGKEAACAGREAAKADENRRDAAGAAETTSGERVEKSAESKSCQSETVVAAEMVPAECAEASADVSAGRAAESTIRVDVELLDKLMNLVGELVLTRNQTVRFAAGIEDPAFTSAVQRLNIITTELQEGVMKTRMQPVGNVWNKFPRVVRDLATMCKKRVRLEMEGKETELDKTLLEAIKDPLTHIVRNCVDHGIETPEVREAHGKPAEGVISLRASHESGNVNIEICDDGGGIDPERVKAKAIERGLMSAEKASRMNDREILNLIFLPGFSTAEKVTNISGRGVGMDVVRSNLERINGSVDIQSTVGKGTTLRMKIPLTLAIIPALIVESCRERYAIPQAHLLEVVRLEAKDVAAQIELISDAAVYRLRGRLLPLVDLNGELGIAQWGDGSTVFEKRAQRETVNIVVLQTEERQFGLVVDRILDTQEIVVKPLGRQLNMIACYAGAAVMGDGKVALILDIVGLARRARVMADSAASRGKGEETWEAEAGGEPKESADTGLEIERLLVVRVGDDGRIGIPLSSVSRLEEFPQANIERSGRSSVVQYRGDILPLVDLSTIVGEERMGVESDGPLQVVVCSDRGRAAGLVVEEILDIVEDRLVVKSSGTREGVRGSTVIQEKVTELIDLEAVLARVEPRGNRC